MANEQILLVHWTMSEMVLPSHFQNFAFHFQMLCSEGDFAWQGIIIHLSSYPSPPWTRVQQLKGKEEASFPILKVNSSVYHRVHPLLKLTPFFL